jgi:hypothetical protein
MKNYYYHLFQRCSLMSNYSEDTVRRAAEIREWLIRQISDKEDEIERLRTTLSLVDILLKQGSFKNASILGVLSQEVSSPPSLQSSAGQTLEDNNSSHNSVPLIPPKEVTNVTAMTETAPPTHQQYGKKEFAEVRPLKRLKDNLLLANAKLSQSSIQIIPAEGINLNVNTPPFKSFFLNRILDGMKSKDVEKSSLGQIKESESLNYEVEDNNGLITKIIINNYREKERLSEIFNTSTWVFTRMIEKSTRQ